MLLTQTDLERNDVNLRSLDAIATPHSIGFPPGAGDAGVRGLCADVCTSLSYRVASSILITPLKFVDKTIESSENKFKKPTDNNLLVFIVVLFI